MSERKYPAGKRVNRAEANKSVDNSVSIVLRAGEVAAVGEDGRLYQVTSRKVTREALAELARMMGI